MSLKEIGVFESSLSVEDTNQMITMWETLKEPQSASFNGNNRNISILNRRLSLHN